jgi:hypothetical protein
MASRNINLSYREAGVVLGRRGNIILNVKTNTTVTMDDTVLSQARQAAAAEGKTLSAWTERAVRAELMRVSATIAAAWERSTGDAQPRALAELEEQRAMSEAIRTSGQAW